MACIAVRTMLFSGCCAVSVEPAVCVWKRSIHERGLFALEAVAHDACPQPARGAELRDFLQKIIVRVEEKREARREVVDVETGVDARPAHTRCRWPA